MLGLQRAFLMWGERVEVVEELHRLAELLKAKMHTEIAASAATFHVLHSMEKQCALWEAYGLARTFLWWAQVVAITHTEYSWDSPVAEGGAESKSRQAHPVTTEGATKRGQDDASATLPDAVAELPGGGEEGQMSMLLPRDPLDVSCTWAKPGRLGVLLHSKTQRPVGAIVKSTNLPEVDAALREAGVETGMIITRVGEHDVVDVHYSDVMIKLKTASRPLTICFNQVNVVETWWLAQKERE